MITGRAKDIQFSTDLDFEGDMAVDVDGGDCIDKGMALDVIAHLAKAFDISVVITLKETN